MKRSDMSATPLSDFAAFTTYAAYAAFAGLALIPMGAHACAGCRNPNMPVTRVEAVQLSPGELRVGASLGGMGVGVIHEAGCADPAHCHELPVQPLFLHDQHILSAELRPVLELGLTDALGLEVQLPIRFVRTSIEYTTPDGAPYQPLDPGIHHRDETLAGFGDPWLLARWAGSFGGLVVSTRAGVSVPIGSTESNPFVLGDEGKRHQHIQFGSGTFDPILALDLSRTVGPWLLSGYAQGQAALYENGHGFRAGAKASGGAQVGRRLWRSLTGAVGAEAAYEGPERWDGEIRQDGNLGRTEGLAAFSLVQAFRTGTIGLSARMPFYRHIVAGDEDPGTISAPLMLGLFTSRTFPIK